MKEKKTTEEITEMEMTNKQCAIINAAQLPISFSPTKEGPKSWIHSRNLYVNDNLVLESWTWVSNNIIAVTQCLVKEQCQGNILGGVIV
jgi:hypothetical protein